ncbi:cysteine peptidase family C39 domain-containing protein [Pseudoduganella sp. SL102]|nr:cysteine peptidase family C39 domain-containing protein [Pseudoduganella sp. SL102]WBS03680.1 cysteine peptidase family C39 domain-containing protein [Pseudoduganella sp. SL102]
MNERHPGRVRTPTILQVEAVECGAAALAMVLAHHGRWVPLEALRQDCGVSRNGSKASNLLKCARRHGLVAKGFSKEADALAALPVPSILHWNFNHFLVFEGVRDGVAWLNDPAMGARSVTMEELAESFTGVVLVFEKGPDFAPAGRAPSLLREMGGWLRHSRSALAFERWHRPCSQYPACCCRCAPKRSSTRCCCASSRAGWRHCCWRWPVPCWPAPRSPGCSNAICCGWK